MFLKLLILFYLHGEASSVSTWGDWMPRTVERASKRDDTVEFADLKHQRISKGTFLPKPRKEFREENVLLTLDPESFDFTLTTSSKVISRASVRYRQLIFPILLKSAAPKHKAVKSLVVSVKDEMEPLNLDASESYELIIASPTSVLSAKTVWGALRGLETFSQAVFTNGSGYFVHKNKVIDYPRFKFRGFLIDTSRHYLSKRKILQFLDAMSYSKMNVLHWHIVDDQSFPFVSEKFPDLHKKGAFNSATHVYRQKDIKDIIKYARDRAIIVMPEFDTPGHTHSWNGISGLLTNCRRKNEPEHIFDDMKGPMNPINESTYTFLTDFFDEVAAVFPSEYIHLGGDEVDSTCWLSNPEIRKWLLQHGGITSGSAILHTHFVNRVIKIVSDLKKKYIVWQDVFDEGAEINESTIVEVWKSDQWRDEMRKVTEKGHKAILASCWYLNNIKYGLDWPDLYKCDPHDFSGTEQQKDLVIGGSAAMWGEYVDGSNLIQRSFGRGFAVAERLWSGREVVSVDNALPRMWEHQCRYLIRKIPVEPITRSTFCDHEWDEN